MLSCPGADVKVIATVNVHTEKRYAPPLVVANCQPDEDEEMVRTSLATADGRFEKWASEKSKRKARGQPAIVDYRDETYVSPLSVLSDSSGDNSWFFHCLLLLYHAIVSVSSTTMHMCILTVSLNSTLRLLPNVKRQTLPTV